MYRMNISQICAHFQIYHRMCVASSSTIEIYLILKCIHHSENHALLVCHTHIRYMQQLYMKHF